MLRAAMHRIPWTLAVALLGLGLLVHGCGPATTRPAEPDPAARAVQLEATGNHEGAAAEYLRLAGLYPGRAAHYQLLAAEAWLATGGREEARAILDGLETEKNSPDRLHLDILEARFDLMEQRPQAALERLGRTPGENTPPLLAAHRHEVRAQAFEAMKHWADAARERVLLSTLPGGKDGDRLERLWADFSAADPARLEALRQGEGPVFGSWAELALLTRELSATPELLAQSLDAWMQAYPSHPAIPAITGDILARSQRFRSRPEHIALLLPLTGQYQQVAAAVRDGFMAAWYAEPAFQPQIRIYDANALNAPAQYRLAVQEGAQLVVGPLEKAAIEALLREKALTVPTLALNQLDNPVAEPGPPGAGAPTLMQFALSPEDEARQAAQRAWFDGHVRALVIAPDNAWGRRLADAFRAEWEFLGGTVLESVVYEPALNDFSVTVSEMMNIDSSAQRARELRERLGRRLEYGTRLRQDADMIFMAALPVAARQIIPQLRFYSADHLPVYSSSHAFAGSGGARLESDLDGMLFPDMPWVLAPSSAIEAAAERNWSVRTSGLRRLYAFGADAFSIIPHLPRLSLQPGSSFAGATGELSMGRNGEIVRRLPWARVRDGTPRLLETLPGG